jgi:homoserine O-succinyltransferase/O-acetyltransferase
MSWPDKKLIRIAILDLYAGQANQGMRCIREIINQWAGQHNLDMEYDEFDVRLKNEVPGIDYDIYISSGGPGDPWEKPENKWDAAYFGWIDSMLKFNNDAANQQKKFVFFICHSFQLAARHFNIGKVCKRNSTAFGVFPVHMLNAAYEEIVFQGLKDPFYSVDSRDYQVIEPNYEAMEKAGTTLLCIEKSRPHVPYERALMGVRFNDYMIGTQFHPEADAIGMSMYLQTEEKKKTVIDNHGEAKWSSMIEQLNDPDKIMWTYNHILPNFLNQAVGQLQEVAA